MVEHKLWKQHDSVVGSDYWQCVVCFKECWLKSDFTFECIPKYNKKLELMKVSLY